MRRKENLTDRPSDGGCRTNGALSRTVSMGLGRGITARGAGALPRRRASARALPARRVLPHPSLRLRRSFSFAAVFGGLQGCAQFGHNSSSYEQIGHNPQACRVGNRHDARGALRRALIKRMLLRNACRSRSFFLFFGRTHGSSAPIVGAGHRTGRATALIRFRLL